MNTKDIEYGEFKNKMQNYLEQINCTVDKITGKWEDVRIDDISTEFGFSIALQNGDNLYYDDVQHTGRRNALRSVVHAAIKLEKNEELFERYIDERDNPLRS